MKIDRSVMVASWMVRIALAAAFLSAVADRFGVWGPPGAAGGCGICFWSDWGG